MSTALVLAWYSRCTVQSEDKLGDIGVRTLLGMLAVVLAIALVAGSGCGESRTFAFEHVPSSFGMALSLHDDIVACEVLSPQGETSTVRYHLDGIERFIARRPEVKELLGFEHVEMDCGKMERVVALKGYLRDLDEGKSDTPRPDFLEEAKPDQEALVNGWNTSSFGWLLHLPVQGCNTILLSERHVLTSAHCADNFPDGSTFAIDQFRPGRWDQRDDITTGTICWTDHPDYSGWLDDADDLAVMAHCDGSRFDLAQDVFAPLARTFSGAGAVARVISAGPNAGTCPPVTQNNKEMDTATIDALDSEDIELNHASGTGFQTCSGDSGAAYLNSHPNNNVTALHSGSRWVTSSFSCGTHTCYRNGEAHGTRIWVPKESWIEQVLGFQCYEYSQHADRQRQGGETTTSTCTDGLDNDADGLYDCDDPGCNGVSACSSGCVPVSETGSRCLNGQDDDCDGFTDCADSNCFSNVDCLGL